RDPARLIHSRRSEWGTAMRRGVGRALVLGCAILVGVVMVAARASAAGPAECVWAQDADWTEPERWVWGRLCASQEADLASPEREAGGERGLRAKFLRAILQAEPFAGLLPPGPIRIVAAQFPEAVDLTGVQLKGDRWLELIGARFGSDLVLADARLE